jgi:hypothetical protein
VLFNPALHAVSETVVRCSLFDRLFCAR